MTEVVQGRVAKERILSEPSARNTSACIGYAAMKIVKNHGDGVMAITPSDAYIKDNKTFAKVLEKAIERAKNSDSLITVGITPTFPSTGYGYIRMAKSSEEVKEVIEFVEKPDLATAQKYLAEGDYVWNSGMFVWKASVILEKFKTYLPDVYEDLLKIADKFGTEEELETTENIYPKIRSISIDYGVMEKSDNILVVPGEFGWNDVGSWDMLGVLNQPDDNGNITIGDNVCVESSGNIIYSSGKTIALVGAHDMIVVETPDAILVCPKDKAQDVKKIVDYIKETGREELL